MYYMINRENRVSSGIHRVSKGKLFLSLLLLILIALLLPATVNACQMWGMFTSDGFPDSAYTYTIDIFRDISIFSSNGNGHGYGNGYGYGSGNCYGSGKGYGSGNGNGSGSGNGYGSGNGNGNPSER